MTASDGISPEMAAARAKLQAKMSGVRTGGAGSARRKRVAHHQSNTVDDKKLQAQLKQLRMSPIPSIDEVNMFREDGKVLHFEMPKMQASVQANTFAITGHMQEKSLEELLPGILTQLGPEALKGLKDIAAKMAVSGNHGAVKEEDDEVPELVEDFEEVSKSN